MRVLTLTNGYPPHYYGGYELTCFDVMQRFMQAGHDVTVVTSTARVPGVDEPDVHDVRRTLEASWDWETNRKRQSATPLGWLRADRRNLAELAAVVEEVRPDVVSVWHMIGLPMSLLGLLDDRRLPMVVTVGNEWMVIAPDFDPWHRMWRRWPGRRPSSVAGVPTQLASLNGACVNFVSDFVKRLTIERGQWRVDPGAPIVHPGIELADFPVASRPARPWSWRLLYVGRVDPVKGVATLIRAVAQLPADARLEIIGGGPHTYIAEMKSLAEQLGLAGRVTFNRCPRDRLRERYLAADALVFPSEWDEPFGLVPLEGMACGVPVVATATGGAAEFLRDRENCLLFPAGDATALVSALRLLASDGTLVDTMVEGGLRTASMFTIDRYAEHLLDLHYRQRDVGRQAMTQE